MSAKPDVRRLNRQAFGKWLQRLPPDEEFCEGNQCPLEMYRRGSTRGSIDWRDDDWREEFIARIDNKAKGPQDQPWKSITPREALDILAKVA